MEQFAYTHIVEDFQRVAHVLSHASAEIRRQRHTSFPIFICCEEPPKVGVCLVASGENGALLHYHASMLEELVTLKLIEDSGKFRHTYKDPDIYCCLLATTPQITNFLYLPYPKD